MVCANHHSIVDRRADLDATFNGQTARQAQHLGAVALHREVSERSWVGNFADMDMPTERGVQFAGQHRGIERGVGPFPELAIGLAMHA